MTRPSHAAPISKPSNRDELRAAAGLAQDVDSQLTAAQFALVLFAGGNTLGAFIVLGEVAPIRLDLVVTPDKSGARSGRSAEAAKKRVVIVGAGSVGSKLAECLLRSGVHRLTLVDGDVMLPANLERHALDWRDVGYRKVMALKRRLLSIVPGARVKKIANNLNWQRSARIHAWQVEALAALDAELAEALRCPDAELGTAALHPVPDRDDHVEVEVLDPVGLAVGGSCCRFCNN